VFLAVSHMPRGSGPERPTEGLLHVCTQYDKQKPNVAL